MDSSAPSEEAGQPPPEEQIQLEQVSVQPSSSDTATATNLSQPRQDTAAVAPSSPVLEAEETAHRAPSSPPYVVASSLAPVPDDQAGAVLLPGPTKHQVLL